jgi:polyhydroxyalkanoate synthesis regulator phasin
MTIAEFLNERWESIAALATVVGAGKVTIDRNKKKLVRDISDVDQKQDAEIETLNLKIDILTEKISKFENKSDK